MYKDIKDRIKDISSQIASNYEKEALFRKKEGKHLPNRRIIIDIIKDLKKIMFPGYFDDEDVTRILPDYAVGHSLSHIYEKLKEQVQVALLYEEDNANVSEVTKRAEAITITFCEKIPYLQNLLIKDIEAAYNGDPAANSKEEIIFSYPCLFAIYIYRLAHELYVQKVPLLPRIMTEYAHSKTGMDINAGARIGEYFFIDHGTGVVIGETTIIGNNVKLYQGVTLGALSTRDVDALKGSKRHPTIEDNVTIYSGASILGGNTIIGHDSVIGGNSFIVSSVPANTKVSIKNPELNFR